MSTPSMGPEKSSGSLYPLFDFYSTMMATWAHHPHKELFKGLLEGATEVAVDQPLVTFKNILQKRIRTVKDPTQPSPSLWKSLSIRQLYAGACANGTGMSLITGVQMWVMSLTQHLLTRDRAVLTLSPGENLFASSMGGLVAAPIASGSEMLMDKYRENVKQYEKLGKQGPRPTYIAATQELWQQHHWKMLTLGLFPTACRDIGFTTAYGAAGPYFAASLKQNERFKALVAQQSFVPLQLVATIVGSIFAGIIGATVTHPFDTWKTQCQGGLKTNFWPQGVYKPLRQSLQQGYHTRRWGLALQQGLHYLIAEPYKGFGPRFTRVVSAVTLLNVMNWSIDAQFKKYQ